MDLVWIWFGLDLDMDLVWIGFGYGFCSRLAFGYWLVLVGIVIVSP